MISEQKLKDTLKEIRDISRLEMSLYTAEGKLEATTIKEDIDIDEMLTSFATSMADNQSIGGRCFFKVVVDEKVEHILVVNSSSEEAYMVGKLAVCQMRNLTEASDVNSDKSAFMQNLLLGNMLLVDVYNKAGQLGIEEKKRIVYVIEIDEKDRSEIKELLESLFADSNDICAELERNNIVFVHEATDIPDNADAMEKEEYLDQTAEVIKDAIHTETLSNVRIGYGNCVDTFSDIQRSYHEAKMALEVGRIFYVERETISYARLGIGRLIYQLPTSLCEMFIREVFGDDIPEIFEEENLSTIQKFFDNNLNISETARQLYVHRNTLVYRLERLEKTMGLDIRKFDDAMTFQIAYMVLSHMADQEKIPLAQKIKEFSRKDTK
ncbi:MAG: helix-turn-helix domain-containing protein [Lachnospiraceae bacterium]|nr:helix-turn-helix domain-containing protein [Lachnospiraceae bacterium]